MEISRDNKMRAVLQGPAVAWLHHGGRMAALYLPHIQVKQMATFRFLWFWSSVTYTLRQTRLRSVSKLLLCVVPLPFCSHPFFAPWPQITLMWHISSAMRTPSANAYKVGQQAQSEMESLKRQAIGRSWDVLGSNWHNRKSALLWVWNIDAQQHDHLAIWDCFLAF